MKLAFVSAVAALLFLGACTTNNSRPTTQLNTDETPSGGVVPGQVPQ